MQIPGFLSAENKVDQRRSKFLKLAFYSLKIFDKNTIAK